MTIDSKDLHPVFDKLIVNLSDKLSNVVEPDVWQKLEDTSWIGSRFEEQLWSIIGNNYGTLLLTY